ncbi:MAG TPA: S41 family peptidase, partial [bacterium]|nr:S41 family peptidase [bacterium]
ANNIYKQILKFQEILNHISRAHISNPKAEDLINGAIDGMIKSLDDPYTVYMEEKETEHFQDRIKAHFGGIGIRIGTYTDEKGDTYLQIIDLLPVKESPARKAGLRAKDVILKIDARDAKNMPFDEAKNYLRGEVGSEVILTILRLTEPADSQNLIIPVIRGEIEILQTSHKMLSDSIAYLRLDNFTELSAKEIKEALEIITDSGAEALIFDLRSNPGGLLQAAVDISGYFLSDKKRIVYTKNKENAITSEYFSTANQLTKLPLIILTNEYSASASEIVTGALKAYRRALIVGKKTFGKGSVQQVINFSDKTSLKITNAYYFTPDDKCINKIGIEPDIEVSFKRNTDKDDQLETALDILRAFRILKNSYAGN